MSNGFPERKKAFNWKSIVVTLLSLGLLVFTIRNSGLQWSHLYLSAQQWIYFLAAMGVLVFTLWVQSIRAKIPWEAWFEGNKIDTFNGLLLGSFYNCVLPGNLGEGMRAWHFSRKNKVSFVRSLASVGMEKYLDGLNFIVYTIMLLLLFPEVNLHFRLISTVAVLVGIVFVLYLIIIFQRKVEKAIMGLLLSFLKPGKWLYKLHYHLKGFLLKFNKERLLRYMLIGGVVFFLNITQYYLAMKATGVPEPLGNMRVAFLVAVTMVLISITPAAPGNVGVIHFGIYTLLTSLAARYELSDIALPQTLALYTVYLHLSYFLPEVIAGTFVLIKERRWLF